MSRQIDARGAPGGKASTEVTVPEVPKPVNKEEASRMDSMRLALTTTKEAAIKMGHCQPSKASPESEEHTPCVSWDEYTDLCQRVMKLERLVAQQTKSYLTSKEIQEEVLEEERAARFAEIAKRWGNGTAHWLDGESVTVFNDIRWLIEEVSRLRGKD